jgi:hypothetical protein
MLAALASLVVRQVELFTLATGPAHTLPRLPMDKILSALFGRLLEDNLLV